MRRLPGSTPRGWPSAPEKRCGKSRLLDIVEGTCHARHCCASWNTDPEAPWSGIGPAGLTGKRLGDLLREFETD